MIKLNIAPGFRVAEAKDSAPAPASLCTECRYARIIRGVGKNEQIISCGYAFPAFELPFQVKECSDYMPRARGGNNKSRESFVVNIPSVAVVASGEK